MLSGAITCPTGDGVAQHPRQCWLPWLTQVLSESLHSMGSLTFVRLGMICDWQDTDW